MLAGFHDELFNPIYLYHEEKISLKTKFSLFHKNYLKNSYLACSFVIELFLQMFKEVE